MACLVEEGGAATTATIPMCAEVIKAAMAYDDGSLDKDNVLPISGAYTVNFTNNNEQGSSGSTRHD